MKEYWRENPDGTRVKVDSDPSNDYADGRRAGIRYANKRKGLWALWWFAGGMAVEAVLLGIL